MIGWKRNVKLEPIMQNAHVTGLVWGFSIYIQCLSHIGASKEIQVGNIYDLAQTVGLGIKNSADNLRRRPLVSVVSIEASFWPVKVEIPLKARARRFRWRYCR